MTPFQVVVGNHRVEMMNVMKPDVSGKPLENFREFVITTAFHGSRGKIPLLTLGPISVFELMLDVEEPDSTCSGNQHHGDLNDDKRKKSKYRGHACAPRK